MTLQLVTIARPELPSESIQRKTPMSCFISEFKKFCDDNECVYECVYICAYKSARDSELDHQPRILKVGSAGRGCRPARVFSPFIITTVQYDENTKSGESGEEVSTSLGILEHLVPQLRHQLHTTFHSRQLHRESHDVAYTPPTRRLHIAYTSPTQGKTTFCKEKRSDYSLMTLGPSLTRTEQCQT